MNTDTTEYIQDQTEIALSGYYRFMSHLGRLTAFEVKENKCGGQYKMLVEYVQIHDIDARDVHFIYNKHYF